MISCDAAAQKLAMIMTPSGAAWCALRRVMSHHAPLRRSTLEPPPPFCFLGLLTGGTEALRRVTGAVEAARPSGRITVSGLGPSSFCYGPCIYKDYSK